jgi:deoxyinosine 3'endonuclease (endonuclease V)
MNERTTKMQTVNEAIARRISTHNADREARVIAVLDEAYDKALAEGDTETIERLTQGTLADFMKHAD